MKVRRSEAEPAIRRLAQEWAIATGVQVSSVEQPSFSAFKAWAEAQGRGDCFIFRSTMGALDDAERWFDQELGQAWRN